MKQYKHRCEKSLYHGGWHGVPCSREGVVQEKGKWWCKQHAPSAVGERAEARDQRWRRKWDLKGTRDKLTEEINKLEAEIVNFVRGLYEVLPAARALIDALDSARMSRGKIVAEIQALEK